MCVWVSQPATLLFVRPSSGCEGERGGSEIEWLQQRIGGIFFRLGIQKGSEQWGYQEHWWIVWLAAYGVCASQERWYGSQQMRWAFLWRGFRRGFWQSAPTWWIHYEITGLGSWRLHKICSVAQPSWKDSAENCEGQNCHFQPNCWIQGLGLSGWMKFEEVVLGIRAVWQCSCCRIWSTPWREYQHSSSSFCSRGL